MRACVCALQGKRRLTPPLSLSLAWVGPGRVKASLLYEDMGDLRRRAERLRQVLGTSDVDRAVELNPTFLDLEQTELAIEEISRLMPRRTRGPICSGTPSMLYSTQARENIICYDGSSEHHD